jgi:flagellar motor component MotA
MMNKPDFEKEYFEIFERALFLSETAQWQGLLSLEDIIDMDKYKQRDILEYGIKFVLDGCDGDFLNKVLSNIVNLESDKDKKILKTIQKEAVMCMQYGTRPQLMALLLNSYVNIGIEEAINKYKEIIDE